MNCGDVDLSPPFVASYLLDGPYNHSIASSASSSSASVWSDASSQSSDDTSVTSSSAASDAEISESYCYSSQSAYQTDQVQPIALCWPQNNTNTVAPELRKHPRRTSNSHGALAQSTCPPALIRQCDRKVSFVDSLVDCSAQIVEAIWPLSSIPCRTDVGSKGVLPLRTFIQETLRRSRTSYSTLQVALYYLILIKPHVPKHDFTMEQTEDTHSSRALQCGRRMFLSALILASKYLQDRNYSARAWSKISGLNTNEINQNEITFLLAVNWRLHITDDIFQKWSNIVLKYTPPPSPPSPGSPFPRQHEAQATEWKSIILRLNAELDSLEDVSSLQSTHTAIESICGMSRPGLQKHESFGPGSAESTPTPSYYTPRVMEPSPSASFSPRKAAPAYGLLPTPRLTPQSVGYRTPAASVSSYAKPAMAFAISSANQAQLNERWITSSPQPYPSQRRSSLANSVSSASSPESMVSDNSSRSSRSSSISSASSGICAPTFKLDVQARCRSAQQYGEIGHRISFAAVPEHCFVDGPTSSPESYCDSDGKDLFELVQSRPHYQCGDDVDAARTLQELQNAGRTIGGALRLSPNKGSKRSRPQSIEQTTNIQDNVRHMLRHSPSGWPEGVVRRNLSSRAAVDSIPRSFDGRKRVCCSSEAFSGFSASATLPRTGLWATMD